MQKFLFSIVLWSLSAAALQAAPVLINGSLTGPIDNAGVPPGWSIISGSPDTMDENNNVGGPFGGWVALPSGPSPDGGTWVGFARDGNFIESFGQNVGGFTPGAEYEISWFQGNFGYRNYNSPNGVEVLVNGSPIGSGSIIPTGREWAADSLTFIAPATNLQIDFRLTSTAISYFSIDGIAIQQTAAVPEPTSLALWGAGLAGLAVLRRRRRS